MNKKIIITCLSAVLSSMSFAQNVITVEDSGRTEVIGLPEGMIVGESELMNDYNNRNNLTEGNANVRVMSYNDSVIWSRLERIPTTIDMPLNDVTRKFIENYTNRRSSVSIMLGAANFYNPIFEEALEKYGLPLELKYLPVIESALRPSATSPVGAAGLWQFMVGTGKRYGLEVNTLVDERRDPVKSSEAAAHYLSDLYNMFGDWGLAIAAYNCGEGNVQKALIRTGNQAGANYWSIYNRLPSETRGYVPAFIAATYIMNYYCEHGIVPRDASLPLESDTIVVKNEVKFAQIASKCNVSVDELRAINPQYRKDIVPKGYTLRLPVTAVEDFIVYEDSIYRMNTSNVFVATGARRAVNADELAAATRAANAANAANAAAVTNSAATSYTDAASGDVAYVAPVAAVEPVQTTTNTRSSYSSTNTRNSYSRSSSKQKKTRQPRQTTKNVTVKSGDTLTKIARANGTTVDNLRKLNPNIKGSMIRPDQKVRVK